MRTHEAKRILNAALLLTGFWGVSASAEAGLSTVSMGNCANCGYNSEAPEGGFYRTDSSFVCPPGSAQPDSGL